MLLVSLNHGIIGSLKLSFSGRSYNMAVVPRVVTFLHDIESQHHCLVFLMPPSGILQLSSSSSKPFTAIAHRFFVRLTPLNNIPEISNEVINLIDCNEPSCSYNGWQRTAK